MANQSAEQPKKQRVKLHGSQGQFANQMLHAFVANKQESCAAARESHEVKCVFQLKVSNMLLSYPEFEFVKSGSLRTARTWLTVFLSLSILLRVHWFDDWSNNIV